METINWETTKSEIASRNESIEKTMKHIKIDIATLELTKSLSELFAKMDETFNSIEKRFTKMEDTINNIRLDLNLVEKGLKEINEGKEC